MNGASSTMALLHVTTVGSSRSFDGRRAVDIGRDDDVLGSSVRFFGAWGSHAVRDGAALAALTGGVVYGAFDLGYHTFYSDLGVSASDVGVDQTLVISQAAVALALYGAVIAVVGLVTYAVVSTLALGLLSFGARVKERPSTRRFQRPFLRLVTGLHLSTESTRRLRLALLTVLLVTVAGPVVLYASGVTVLFYRPFRALTLASMIPPVVLVVVLWRDVNSFERRAVAPAAKPTGFARRRSQRAQARGDLVSSSLSASRRIALIGLVIAFYYVLLTAGSVARGSELATAIRHGYDIPPGQLLAFGFRADPVCVVRTGNGAVQSPFYRLYLGEAGGRVVLYDYATDTTARSESGGLTLVFLDSAGRTHRGGAGPCANLAPS